MSEPIPPHSALALPSQAGVESRVTFDCSSLDAPAIRTAIFWLAECAERTDHDAVIVVSTLAAADCLTCVFPHDVLTQLVAGNIVRLNRGSLFMMTAREVMPQTRRHHIVLTIDLTDDELARVDRMNPASLGIVRLVSSWPPSTSSSICSD